MNTATQKLLTRFNGNYAHAVDVVMTISRVLWNAGLKVEQHVLQSEDRQAGWWLIDLNFVEEQFALKNVQQQSGGNEDVSVALHRSLLDEILTRFAREAPISYPRHLASIDIRAFQPTVLVGMVLQGLRPDYEERYFIMRSLQKRYHCALSDRLAHLFHTLCNVVNSEYALRLQSAPDAKIPVNFVSEFFPSLVAALEQDVYGREEPQRLADVFCESCRAMGLLRAHRQQGCVEADTAEFDAAVLMSRLFGMPTGIPGFDELFGGGLILAENFDRPRSAANADGGGIAVDHLRGRNVLIMGRFGTGKTLLSLQLAVEVARRGGLAIVMPLEQTAQECLYALESVNIAIDHDIMEVATDVFDAAHLLQRLDKSKGALIIGGTVKDNYDNFLKAFQDNAELMSKYPLRMIVADPINSVVRQGAGAVHATELRARTMDIVDQIKTKGTNVLFVAEEGVDADGKPNDELLFEKNIADTVIRLSINSRYNYAQRYFEIQKSRFQREQRGEHPYSISPNRGISIYPSSAAVNNRERASSLLTPTIPIRFGIEGLDGILGDEALFAGDVIVVQGPEGSYRTPLGLMFLLGVTSHTPVNANTGQTSVSLIVAARENEEAIRHMLSIIVPDGDAHDQLLQRIRICPLPQGHINPSVILQIIENEFRHASQDNTIIERVMIDDVSNWELSCPFVRDDETFSNTLVHFLRRKRVTSLMVCGEIPEDIRAVVQGPMIQQADCLLRCEQREFRGQRRIMLHIVKTRGMKHRREVYELAYKGRILEVNPDSSLLRMSRSGELQPVCIHLFLYSETDMQREYNERFLNTIKAVFSREAEVDSQDRFYIGRAMELGYASVIDELQIVQIDEFQLPHATPVNGQSNTLYTFSDSQWKNEGWDDIRQTLRARVQTADKAGFFAVPYYNNVGLLAYDSRQLKNQNALQSWSALAAECKAWEDGTPDENRLFFDFGWANPENYNCLFFEMLAAETGAMAFPGDFHEWLDHEKILDVCRIFRRLCRRAHMKREGYNLVLYDAKQTGESLRVDLNAVVWRHWYSSLNQMIVDLAHKRQKRLHRGMATRVRSAQRSEFSPENLARRQDLKVVPLPNHISVAGEWYLGIPLYSASPHVGLEMIKLLTSNEAELDRQRMGIGLPTRVSLLGMKPATQAASETLDTEISPYFSMRARDVEVLFDHVLRRSELRGYSKYAKYLTYSLRRILELPCNAEKEPEEAITQILNDLKEKLPSLV